MPRPKKTDKFYIVQTPSGYRQLGKRMLSVNISHENDKGLTFQDLIDFLKNKEVKLDKISLPPNFITFITE